MNPSQFTLRCLLQLQRCAYAPWTRINAPPSLIRPMRRPPFIIWSLPLAHLKAFSLYHLLLLALLLFLCVLFLNHCSVAIVVVVDVVLAMFFQGVCNCSVLKHQKLTTTTAEAEQIKVTGK